MLQLVIHISDIQVITVETTCGRCYKFHDSKQLAGTGTGFESFLNGHEHLLNGVELEDHCTISEICKINKSVINLLIHKPAKVKTRTTREDFWIIAFAPQVNTVPLIEKRPLVKPIIVHPWVVLNHFIMDMIESVNAVLEKGHRPSMALEGTGGTYFMSDGSGRGIGVFLEPSD